MSHWLISSGPLTIELCIETCFNNSFLYAGVQYRLEIVALFKRLGFLIKKTHFKTYGKNYDFFPLPF
jgi:hypothetical protein